MHALVAGVSAAQRRLAGDALIYWLLSVLMCCVFSAPAHAANHSYFDMEEEFASDESHFPKWTTMVERFITEQRIPDSQCDKVPYHPCTIFDWRHFLERQKERPFHEQLNAVNDFANAFPYVEDWTNWGVEDYWETPYEFLAVSGDCEDYAIIKYYSLKRIGIPVSRMRLIVLQDLNLGGVIHAILGVYDSSGELWLLDNQIKQVVPARRVYHYKPIYGINEEGWWAYYPRM